MNAATAATIPPMNDHDTETAPLSPAERQLLKARAHALDPVVMIGGGGVTDTVAAEIDRALTRHELIKIRVLGDDREARARYLEEICARTGARPVQHIGKILVVYRPHPPEALPESAPLTPGRKSRPKPKSGPGRVLGRAAPRARSSGPSYSTRATRGTAGTTSRPSRRTSGKSAAGKRPNARPAQRRGR